MIYWEPVYDLNPMFSIFSLTKFRCATEVKINLAFSNRSNSENDPIFAIYFNLGINKVFHLHLHLINTILMSRIKNRVKHIFIHLFNGPFVLKFTDAIGVLYLAIRVGWNQLTLPALLAHYSLIRALLSQAVLLAEGPICAPLVDPFDVDLAVGRHCSGPDSFLSSAIWA